MFKFLGNKKLFLLLIGLIFSIALMGFSLGNNGTFIGPAKLVKEPVSWLQGLVYKPAGYIAGLFTDIGDVAIVYQENKVLKRTLSKYAKDTARLNEIEKENERLKEALGYTERQKQANNYRYHLARVIAVSPDPFNHTVVIDLGEKDGIRHNMAVVTTDGLLGRIDSVSSFSANVQLLTGINESDDTSKAIAVTVKGKEDSYGIVTNFNEDMLTMTKIPQTDLLAEGDTIVTSGLGHLFPPGIEIGKVVSKEIGEFGITYKATIQPYASFHHLREVFVVEVPELPE